MNIFKRLYYNYKINKEIRKLQKQKIKKHMKQTKIKINKKEIIITIILLCIILLTFIDFINEFKIKELQQKINKIIFEEEYTEFIREDNEREMKNL